MDFSDYRSHDGIALAELLAKGEISPREAMACAIDGAETYGKACNAITYPRYEAALAEAGKRTPGAGRFDGVPFLLKDAGLASTDLPTSIGSRLFEGTTSPADATLTKRFREAGFITFGRTTSPEMGMAPTTEAVRYGGPTRNPFDLTRSSGGSSGGAGVAVASGIVPVAHGSDGGGSIRIPAACCGVFGLKPSRGRIPMGPFRGEGWGGLACDGVLSRSVRDTARVFDLVGGMEPGAPYAAPGWDDGFEAGLTKAFDRPLRIAVWDDPWGRPVAEEPRAVLAATARACEALGHEVVRISPPEFDYDAFVTVMITVMSANAAVSVRNKLAGENREATEDDLEPAILDAYRRGIALKAPDYIDAINLSHATARMMARMIADYDFILTPTLTKLPLELGWLSMAEPDFVAFRTRAGQYTPFLAIINASGQPAANLPMGRAGNLPVGVQAIGHFGRDDMVLRLAAQLETTDLWTNAARWPVLPDAG